MTNVSPAPQRPRSRACPVAAVEDALLLLDSGRPGMARRVLETLPELLLRAERERLLAENEELRGRIAWAAARSPAAAAAAMRERVKASVASLAADVAAVDRYMRAMYAKDEAARPVPATVLPFPASRPVVPAAPARRAA